MHFHLLNYLEGSAKARAGILIGEQVYPISDAGFSPDVSTMDILQDWSNSLARLQTFAANGAKAGTGRSLAHVKLAAPLLYPGQIYGVGLNYREQVAASGPQPLESSENLPWFYQKPPRVTVVGPDADVELPAFSQKVDWEVELAVVIGREARNVSSAEALDYVAGYTIANDLSARDTSRPNVPADSPFRYDFLRAKGFQGACPLGPWITPASQIPDPHALGLKLWLGDELMQDSSTSHMIFTVGALIAALSRNGSLYPGDVILTGTPGGIGMSRNRFLRSGEAIRLWIEEIGELRHTVR